MINGASGIIRDDSFKHILKILKRKKSTILTPLDVP